MFAGSSNGRTAAFEAVYLGPNPNPAAPINENQTPNIFNPWWNDF